MDEYDAFSSPVDDPYAGFSSDVSTPILAASFMDRLQADFSKRLAQGQQSADRYVAGDQGAIQTGLQFAGKIGAGTANDAAGEVLKTITPQFVKDAGSDVINYIGNTRAGNALAGAAGKVGTAYSGFAQNHPALASDIESVADIGGLLPTGKIIGGAAPIVKDAATASLPVVQKAGQLVLDARVPLSDDVNILHGIGVRTTSGQRAAGSVLHNTENKATSLPATGYGINKAYQRGFDDFNRGVTNDVLSPIGKILPDNISTGHDAISHAYEIIGDSYNTVLPKMSGNITDQGYQQDMQSILQRVTVLPDAQKKQVQSILDDAVTRYADPSTGVVSGSDNKEIMRRLNYDASRFAKSQDPDHQTIGVILGDAKSAFSNMLKRNNPASLGKLLDDTDLAYAKYVRLEQAGVAASNNNGVFTPAQLMSAVRKTDGSVRKGAVARGDALMQRLAQAGQNVLPNKVPDSGTAGRLALTGTLAGLSTFHPAALAALGGDLTGAALYSRPGQAVLRGASKVIRK